MGFSGFPRDTVAFLESLKANNTPSWFEGHKADYEGAILKPAAEFIKAVGPKLKAASKRDDVETRINGSVFRMEQGAAGGETPYKASLDLWFWEGEEKSLDLPGYYLRITPDRLVVGAGLHRFSPVLASVYRVAVMNEKAGPALAGVIKGLQELELVPPPAGAKLPEGVDAGVPQADLLRHKGLLAEIDIPLPKTLFTPRIVDQVLEKWLDGQPLVRWISAAVVVPARAAVH
ncbi:MAG: DUF2461 domain-containing protein [Proteobacteria bacterium]|nr:DUF2461 domain-containing protein [Pseudomonadota bacterium]